MIKLKADIVQLDLDNFFREIVNLNNSRPYGRFIPKFEQEVSKYQKIIQMTKRLVRTNFTGQYYDAIFRVVEGFYCLRWDIDAALDYIKNNSILPIELQVKKLWEESIDQRSIDWNYVNNSLSNDVDIPIIVVKIGFDEQLRVIDGNHRLAKVWSHNPYTSSIKAYVLNEWEHHKCLAGPGYSFVYRIVDNCRRNIDFLINGNQHEKFLITYSEALYHRYTFRVDNLSNQQ